MLSRPPTGMARGRAAASRGVGGSCPADLGADAFFPRGQLRRGQKEGKSFVSGLRTRSGRFFGHGMQPETSAVVDDDDDGDDENDY